MVSSFIEELAKPQSSPGGGAAAAYGAALGLALLQKAIQLETRRPHSSAGTARVWSERLVRVRDLAVEIGRLGEEDCRSYARIRDTRSRGESQIEIDAAIGDSVRVLTEIIKTAQQGLALALEAGKVCKAYLVPDLQTASELLAAGAEGAYCIAEANLRVIKSNAAGVVHRNALVSAINRARNCLATARSDLDLKERSRP